MIAWPVAEKKPLLLASDKCDNVQLLSCTMLSWAAHY